MGFRLPNGEDLSVEQLDIINLPTTQNWVIEGAPGTGKTVMSIYRAEQARSVSKNKPVLLLVYNRPLCDFISTAIVINRSRNVQVATYDSWMNEIYKEHDLGLVPRVNRIIDWQDFSIQRLSGIGRKYSHVIIDEAQDFPRELLEILAKISDTMTCFIDPNQAIEIRKTDVIDVIKSLCVESKYKLTKNFRNTQPIRNLSSLYCTDGEPALSSIPGRKPSIIKCISGTFVDQNRKMAEIILRNREKDIGIIVNSRSLNKTYDSMREILPSDLVVQMHKPNTSHRIDFDRPGVKIMTYGTMKGLEFDVVLLPSFDKIKTEDGGKVDCNRVYVAISRAVSELYLFYWDEYQNERWISSMEALTENRDLLEWR